MTALDTTPVHAAHIDQIISRLRKTGAAIVEGLGDRDDVRYLASTLADIRSHPDADGDGITVVHHRGGQLPPTHIGFGDQELHPHTDGSGVPRPPSILLMACHQPATSGGASLFVDGQALYDDLLDTHPETIGMLSAPRCALFGGAAGHLGAVFEIQGDLVSVRLRLDALAKFSPQASRALPALRAAIDRHTTELTLTHGQGYIVNNRRWLHARTAFTGPRVMYRVIGDARPDIELPAGFMLQTASLFSPPSMLAARPS